MRHIILGTAGHIDHGKSALVKALTGTDPDRLKEEKERGITIDIGFADLMFPEEDLAIGIVDVPGHEKLISNMLAGAGGIDMVLLVIAADEGIMPQSREHLAICNILEIKSGLVALTKTDLVEKDWLDLVTDDIRSFVKGTFLENAPIIPVSAKSGENLEPLKNQIKDVAIKTVQKTSGGLFRLPIDRVFTLKGFGTVITGTAVSGTISIDNPLQILPRIINTKIRGLHSHGRPIDTAYAGQRVAINLQGIEKDDLRRGDVAVTPTRFQTTNAVDVYLELLENTPVLKSRSRVHFFVGTSETIARVILYGKEDLKAGETCFCQLRLQDSVVTVSGDRYIIRRFSPLETLGGGEILDPFPAKRRRKEGTADLSILHHGVLEQKIALKIEKAGIYGIAVQAIHGWIQADLSAISDALQNLTQSGEIIRYEDTLLHSKVLHSLHNTITEYLSSFHRRNPLKPGVPKEEARSYLKVNPRLFSHVIASLDNVTAERNIIRLRDFRIALSSSEQKYKNKIVELLERGGFQPPMKNDIIAALSINQKQASDILSILSKEGNVVRINESIYLAESSYRNMLSLLKTFFSKKPEMTVAEFRDMLQTSRKYALPFLEYLDASNITLRTGDVRKLINKTK
jgi:selenocysteine-specific elongation factor